MSSAKIYLIRHGQTDWNVGSVFRGRADRPLNDVGHMEAAAVAGALAAERIDAVYASPMKRAVETARPTALARDLQVVAVDGLIDVDFGRWQGMAHDRVAKEDPKRFRLWNEQPHLVTFPDGESLGMVRCRAMRALRSLAIRYEGRTIMVVAHRVVNKVVSAALLGLGNSHFWRIKQDPASINLFEIDGGFVTVHRLNDTAHLKDLPDRIESDF